MLLLQSQSADSASKMYRLWVHEVYRVFYDRLVDPKDRQEFFDFIKVKLTKFPRNFYLLFCMFGFSRILILLA